MELLKSQMPPVYMILKTLWDVLVVCMSSAAILAIVLCVVWLVNWATARTGG